MRVNLMKPFRFIGTSKQSVDDLGWLYAPPYDSKHKKTKRERVEGSGAWLFERDEYQRWYHDTGLGRLLWCHGKPGAGKTFITYAPTTRWIREN